MSRNHVTALLALSALALATPIAFAQVFERNPNAGVANRSNQGGVLDGDEDVALCQGTAGGSRIRENCEAETTTVRTEQEPKFISIEVPALPNTQCGATTTTEYLQLNTIARVNGTLKIADCAAASGAFTVALRVRDESGEDKPLEFNETWQRSDDQDVQFAADYPIGENVELVGVRVRRLSCTCTDDPAPTQEGSE
jgi:hypothetical protein